MRSRTHIASPRRAAGLRLVVLGGLLLVGSTTAPAAGQSAAGWGQFQGDGAHMGGLSEGAAPPYREAWRFDPELTGRFGVSAPVVAGDLVVTVGPRAVYGVDLATGGTAWEVPRVYGPSATPAVAAAESGDLLIYTEGYGTHFPDEAYPSATPTGASSTSPSASGSPSPSASGSDASGSGDQLAETRVRAVDLATRTPAWKRPIPLEAVSRTGVTVDGQTAFVGDDDGIITAIDVSTGEVRWTFDAPGPVATSIAVASDAVVFSTQPRTDEPAVLIALHAADGSEAWRFEATSGPFVASIPAIAGDTVVAGFLDQSGSRVRAFSLADGTERWARSVTSQLSFLSAPVVTSDAAYVLDVSGQVRGLSLSTGEELWDYALNAFVPRAVPALAGAALLVPTNRGSLVTIDTQSHDLVARASAEGPQGYLGALAVTPTLVVAVKGGHHPGLVAFEHDDAVPLLGVPSPTVLVPGRMVANFAIVAVPMFVLLALAGRWLRRRIGPAFDDDGMPAEDLETVTES